MQNLYNKKIRPSCKYCLHGKIAPDYSSVLCFKHGVVELTSFCKSFKYDPLKRVPKKAPKLMEFSKEEFVL